MGTIRPLFVEIPRKQFDLQIDWQRGFKSLPQDGPRIDATTFQHLETWLRCYVDKLHIASFSADQKLVLRALRSISSRISKLKAGHSVARERWLRSHPRQDHRPTQSRFGPLPETLI